MTPPDPPQTLADQAPTIDIPVRVELAGPFEETVRASDPEDPTARVPGSDPVSPPAPALSRRVGRYLVEEEIGRGGMGIVYRVFDRDLRRQVAMKVLPYRPDEAPRLLERFVEEAQATGQLQHPGIIPVHEIGLDPEGRLFFTMELVHGRTLAEVVEGHHRSRGRGEWSRYRLIQVVSEVARTVAYAHDLQVIHRDLKPQNIMLGRHGQVRVMDWGLAKVLGEGTATPPHRSFSPTITPPKHHERTQSGEVMGTPAYMSPEQARGEADQAGPETDIYALGATLYHVLTGAAPFDGSSTREVLDRVVLGEWLPPRQVDPTVPRELDAICRKAMALKPADRYPTAAAFCQDLQAYLEGRPVTALPERWPARLGKLARRHPVVTWTIGIGLVLGFMVSHVALYLVDQAREAEKMQRQAADRSADRARRSEQEALAAKRFAEENAKLQVAQAQLALGQLRDAVGLLRALTSSDEPEVAAEAARQLAELEPEFRERYLQELAAGGQLVQRGELEEGLTALSLAAGWLPDAYLPDFHMARALIRAGRTDEGLERFKEALAKPGATEEAVVGCGDFDRLRDDVRFLNAVAAAFGPEARIKALHPWRTGWHGEVLPPGMSRGAEGIYQWDGGRHLSIEMVYVPAGEFVMGSDRTVLHDPEGPSHTHTIPYGYYIGRYETTWFEYQAFCQESGRAPPASPPFGIEPAHPVVGVDREEALAFCRWLGLQLPSEPEWEKAARGVDGRTFPWGDNASHLGARCNWRGTPDFGGRSTAPAGYFPLGASPFGAENMAGNVREWCREPYEVDAYTRYARGDFSLPVLAPEKSPVAGVVRGGSWRWDGTRCRAAHRPSKAAHVGWRQGDLGFRPVLLVR